jgi:hypothetical protein
MSLFYLDTEQDERTAVKTAVALAISRYRDTIGKFVQDKPDRLTLVSDQVGRIAQECAVAARANPEEVERKFKSFLADAVAVSDPEKQNVTDSAEYNNSDEVPQPEHGVRDDIKGSEAVLDEGADATVDLDGESTVDSNSFISKEKEAVNGPVTCPQCGHTMTPLQNPQAPGAVTQQQCPNCQATFTPGAVAQPGAQPGVVQPGAQPGMYAKCARCEKDSVEEGSILCEGCNHFVLTGKESKTGTCPECGEKDKELSYMQGEGFLCADCSKKVHEIAEKYPPHDSKKEAQGGGDLQDPELPLDESTQSPAEQDPNDPQLPPAAREDSNGPAEVYTGVVQQMGNTDAAMTWSTPGDQDIADIAQEYQLDPDTVRKELRIVADFGDAVAVNGDPNGDPNVDGLVELQGVGGRIPTTESEVDVDNAISHTADQTGLSPDDVYALVKESYGGDIGGQHYVSVSGEAHYYLPAELVGNQQPQTDVDQPTETPQDALVSSVPAHLQSLAAFIEYEKAQHVSA